MAQQGTSGKPPERRYDETVDPQNPPRAVTNPRVRGWALSVYLGGVVMLFLLMALVFMYWPGTEREVARIDTIEPAPVGTVGEQLPGGFDPSPPMADTTDELAQRGVGEAIGGPMPPLVATAPVTSLREVAEAPPVELAGRRVELEDVEVQARDADTLWIQHDDVRVAVVLPGELPAARPGVRVDVGGVAEGAPDGTVRIRATRVDIRN